jgi:capsular polysaccharide export protein
MPTGQGRTFLFLQGPHGPFFRRLGRMLTAAGAEVWRVGFNAGDRAMWGNRRFIAFCGAPEDWGGALADILTGKAVTDVVLYGDTRPIHAAAVAAARARGITVHVFEEGYLRPYWITYERGGSNGHSRLIDLSVADIAAALGPEDHDLPAPPARWGDMRQHIFWGAAYHACVMIGARAYPRFRPHRDETVAQELGLYLRRIATMPFRRMQRVAAERRVRHGGFPYHLALLQLAHDASFRRHSPFADLPEFIRVTLAGFARGAPPHHHLVFKAHPLDDGRVPVARLIRTGAKALGIAQRVHFVRGGKLAQLLNRAESAVTVNSTAAQQALWRGLPVKAFGAAVYAKPELVSPQPLPAFFAAPQRPDVAAYRLFRRYMLSTSQVRGGFYSADGRREALRRVADMMLRAADPYDALAPASAAAGQHLRLVG